MAKKQKKVVKKGKKTRKPKRPSARYKHYAVNGDKLERKNPFCPKCGSGYFMAVHGNRKTCGKCNYTEFTKKES